MDKIFLHGMKAETLVGVYAWERQRRQTVVIDLDIGITPEAARKAAESDDVAATAHYGEVCALLRRELAERDFRLLESLAEFAAQLVLDTFPAVGSVRLRITKPGILPDVRETGVEIERARLPQ